MQIPSSEMPTKWGPYITATADLKAEADKAAPDRMLVDTLSATQTQCQRDCVQEVIDNSSNPAYVEEAKWMLSVLG